MTNKRSLNDMFIDDILMHKDYRRHDSAYAKLKKEFEKSVETISSTIRKAEKIKKIIRPYLAAALSDTIVYIESNKKSEQKDNKFEGIGITRIYNKIKEELASKNIAYIPTLEVIENILYDDSVDVKFNLDSYINAELSKMIPAHNTDKKFELILPEKICSDINESLKSKKLPYILTTDFVKMFVERNLEIEIYYILRSDNALIEIIENIMKVNDPRTNEYYQKKYEDHMQKVTIPTIRERSTVLDSYPDFAPFQNALKSMANYVVVEQWLVE